MPEFKLRYGTSFINIDIDVEPIKIEPNEPSPTERSIKEVLYLTSDGSKPLHSILKKGEKIAILCPDKTRDIKASILVPQLLEELFSWGIKPEDICIVLATGTHPPHTDEEKEKLLTQWTLERVKVVDHDCMRDCVFIGRTSMGNNVYVNRIVAEADKVIMLGSITFHYFAGFSGGRKIILPGVSAKETIVFNHSMTFSEGAECGMLQDNPVHKDMVEAASLLKPCFLLNIVMGSNGEILKIITGDPFDAYELGCSFVESVYKVPIKEKVDFVIVSAGGVPYDTVFVQVHKAIKHASFALKEGGVMLVIAECSGGLPSEEFLNWFSFKDPDALKAHLLKEYSISGQTAHSTWQMSKKFNIILLSKLNESIVEKMGLIPAKNKEEALSLCAKYTKNSYKCAIMPHGYFTLPFIS